MSSSQPSRTLCVGTLFTGIAAVLLALTGGALWLTWQQHRALHALMKAVKTSDLSAPYPTIVELVKDVRIYGTRAAIGPLVETLAHDDFWVCRHAADALGEIGPEAEAALPALVEKLGDPDPNISGDAASAISKIGLRSSNWKKYRMVPALVNASKNNSWEEIEACIHEIRKIQMTQAAVGELIEELRSNDPLTSMGAAGILGGFGPDAKAAVLSLTLAMKAENSMVRVLAIRALGSIGPEAKDSVPALIGALGDEEQVVRIDAGIALGRIGPKARAAVPALVEAVNDQDAEVCLRAARALWIIDGDTNTALPIIIRFINDPNGYVSSLAVHALRGIGSDAKAAVPALIQALKDNDQYFRQNVSAALNEIDPRVAADAGVNGVKWYEGF